MLAGLIEFFPDMNIEPGHQWLVVRDDEEGRALIKLLSGNTGVISAGGAELMIPHDELVDRNIVALINMLAHARYTAPDLVQLTMLEIQE